MNTWIVQTNQTKLLVHARKDSGKNKYINWPGSLGWHRWWVVGLGGSWRWDWSGSSPVRSSFAARRSHAASSRRWSSSLCERNTRHALQLKSTNNECVAIQAQNSHLATHELSQSVLIGAGCEKQCIACNSWRVDEYRGLRCETCQAHIWKERQGVRTSPTLKLLYRNHPCKRPRGA